MVTFGPRGLSGSPNEIAVHELVMRARTATDTACPLYFVVPPMGVADPGSPALQGARHEAIAACIDIRPWRDVKEEIIASQPVEESPFNAESPDDETPFDREWFAATGSVQRVLTDLYEGGTPDG
jgi:hypothetical protein